MRLPLALFLALPIHAAAESPLPITGFVEVLPIGSAVGDGATPVHVKVLALRPDGAPMEDLSVKVIATGGEATGWTYEGEGIYGFDVLPERVETPGRVSLRIKGKTGDKLKVSLMSAFPVQAPAPLAMTVSANPQTLISGPEAGTTVSFNLGKSPVRLEDLQIRTSVGELGELTSMGAGRYVARLTVGEVKTPALATITASDARRPGRIYGAASVPVRIEKTQVVRARSGSAVLLRIDGRDFGPITAKGGIAKVDVQIPPGATEATQVTVMGDGVARESKLDLRLATTPRLQFLPTHRGFPLDAGLTVEVRLAVFKGDGRPDAGVKPIIKTDAGEVGQVRHEGDGIYVTTITPETRSVGKSFELTAELPDEKGQKDSVTLELTAVRPMRIELGSDPYPLAGAKAAQLQAKLIGPAGQGLTGRELDWNITGGSLDGEAGDAGEGNYTAPIKTYGGPVELLATALTEATGNPVHQLILFPQRGWLPGDTISSAPITVLALDELGYPVSGVLVNIMLESGDGKLPQQVTTDGNGLGRIYYTAGKGLRMVRVRVHTGDASDAVAFLQGPNVLRNVRLPRAGIDSQLALLKLWTPSVSSLRIEP